MTIVADEPVQAPPAGGGRPLRVAFDTLSESPESPSSAVNFFVSFAETLGGIRGTDFVLLVSAANRHLYAHAAAPNVRLVECAASNERIARRILTQQLQLPSLLRREGVDALIGYNVVPLVADCARIVKISTLHHYETPEQFKRDPVRLWYRRLVFKAASRRADFVVANSAHTRDAIARHLDVPLDRVRVVFEAVSDAFRPAPDRAALAADLRERHGLEPGYVLFASTIWRYKNLHTLIRAFARLVEEEARFPHPLVVAGPDGDPPYRAEIDALVAGLGIGARIRFLGGLPNTALVPLFQGAGVFVNPSRSETYGKPVVEAMRCGTPVVAARAASLPEIAGGAALLVDPDDDRAMADAMRVLLAGGEERARCIALGLVRGADFSWARTVEATVDLCREAVARRRR
jgi:glycosyltransferase involved in cell wall biosynthesis